MHLSYLIGLVMISTRASKLSCPVLPQIPVWPLEDEQTLEWTQGEASKYSDPSYGDDVRSLDFNSPAPTALHSWGVALRPCPCQCRAAKFTEHRLQQGGLRGFGMRSQVTGATRFIHPKEALLLNTLPLDHGLVQDA